MHFGCKPRRMVGVPQRTVLSVHVERAGSGLVLKGLGVDWSSRSKEQHEAWKKKLSRVMANAWASKTELQRNTFSKPITLGNVLYVPGCKANIISKNLFARRVHGNTMNRNSFVQTPTMLLPQWAVCLQSRSALVTASLITSAPRLM